MSPAEHPPLPELRTARLLLRRFRPADREDVVALYDDPAANRWDPMAMSAEQVREKFDLWLADWGLRGLSYWIAADPGSGQLMGMGGIRHIDVDEPVLNLAYRFHRRFWGRGYATELARAAVEWAERHVPDVPVSVATTPDNAQSLRVAEKLGFVLLREQDTHGFPEVLLRRNLQP